MRDEFLGVYSTRENRVVSGRNIIAKCLWYAWNWDRGTVVVQEVSTNWEIISRPKIIVWAELESRFSREQEQPPEKPQLPKAPSFSETKKTPIDNKHTLQVVLSIAEETAREDFDSGIKALDLGDRKMAMFAFERPLHMDMPWQPVHKHMFSEFGSILRQKKIYALALRHHSKASELAPNDENILFNMARVYYALGEMNKALDYLQRALAANPNMREGLLFMDYLQRKKRGDPLGGPPLAL